MLPVCVAALELPGRADGVTGAGQRRAGCLLLSVDWLSWCGWCCCGHLVCLQWLIGTRAARGCAPGLLHPRLKLSHCQLPDSAPGAEGSPRPRLGGQWLTPNLECRASRTHEDLGSTGLLGAHQVDIADAGPMVRTMTAEHHRQAARMPGSATTAVALAQAERCDPMGFPRAVPGLA